MKRTPILLAAGLFLGAATAVASIVIAAAQSFGVSDADRVALEYSKAAVVDNTHLAAFHITYRHFQLFTVDVRDRNGARIADSASVDKLLPKPVWVIEASAPPQYPCLLGFTQTLVIDARTGVILATSATCSRAPAVTSSPVVVTTS